MTRRCGSSSRRFERKDRLEVQPVFSCLCGAIFGVGEERPALHIFIAVGVLCHGDYIDSFAIVPHVILSGDLPACHHFISGLLFFSIQSVVYSENSAVGKQNVMTANGMLHY